MHYPLHGGKDVNMVLTLDAAKARDDWQQRYLGRNDILGQLCDHADIKWVKTALPAHPIMIAGDVAEQCWQAMPPIRSRLIWHKVPDKALLMRPAFCAGWRMIILIRRYQAMRVKDPKRLA